MRVVKGKVVGNTVVLVELVDVVLRSASDTDADGWDLSEDRWAEIDASVAEPDAGRLIPADVVLPLL